MPRAARFAEIVHQFVVGIWIGTLIMGAVVAAIIFPTMRELSPHFTRFNLYTSDHADLGAGSFQARVFAAVDLVQFVALFVGLLTLVVSVGARKAIRFKSTIIRSILMGGAMLLFGYQFFVLAPRMDRNAIQYWQAAQAGDTVSADAFREAFSADHPTATRTFGLIGVCAVGLFVCGAWSATSRTEHDQPDAASS